MVQGPLSPKVKLGKVQNEASYLSSRLGAFQKLWLLAFQTRPHLTWCREHFIDIQSRICDWISSMRLNFSCQRASAGENLNTLQHLGSYERATALLCFGHCCSCNCCSQTFPLWDKSLMIGLKRKKRCEAVDSKQVVITGRFCKRFDTLDYIFLVIFMF